MNKKLNIRGPASRRTDLSQQVGKQEVRKLKARRSLHKALWLGFSVTGMVGWGVVVPSLLGLGLGIWLDSHRTGMKCWTLTLFASGLVLGCFNAWYWISREIEAIRRDQEEHPGESTEEGKKHE